VGSIKVSSRPALFDLTGHCQGITDVGRGWTWKDTGYSGFRSHFRDQFNPPVELNRILSINSLLARPIKKDPAYAMYAGAPTFLFTSPSPGRQPTAPGPLPSHPPHPSTSIIHILSLARSQHGMSKGLSEDACRFGDTERRCTQKLAEVAAGLPCT
jgi:hypothetical protein